jgi:hypothetical protein
LLGDRHGSHKRDSRNNTENSPSDFAPDAAPDGGGDSGYPENTYIDIPSQRDESDSNASERPPVHWLARESATGTFGIDPPGRTPSGPVSDVPDVSSAFEPEPPAAGTPPTAHAAAAAEEPAAREYGEIPQVHLIGPGGSDSFGVSPSGPGERPGLGRAVKIGAAAAAMVVLVTGGVVGANMLGGEDPDEGQVVSAARQADPGQAAAQRAAAAAQRRKEVQDAAARAGRDAFRKRPDPGVKVNPKPKPEPESGGGAGQVPASGPVVSGSPRAIARKMLPRFGFSVGSQFGCLDRLWERESGWNPRAANPSSGAYGIPQALPGSKMATAGSDWRTNPATQIEWGLGYIKGRYDTPCGAWSFFQANGSY